MSSKSINKLLLLLKNMDENFRYELSFGYEGESSPRFPFIRTMKFFWHLFNSLEPLKNFDIERCLKAYSKMVDCLGDETDIDFREFKERYLLSARKMLTSFKDYHEGKITQAQLFSEIESIPSIEKQNFNGSYYLRLEREK